MKDRGKTENMAAVMANLWPRLQKLQKTCGFSGIFLPKQINSLILVLSKQNAMN